MKHALLLPYLALLVLLGAGCTAARQTVPPIADLAGYSFRDGDVVIQTIDVPVGRLICGVTRSPYNHCGLVAYFGDQPYVLEAVGPVRYTPLLDWINHGQDRRFLQLRAKGFTAEQLAAILAAGKVFLGKPYDLQYEWSDDKIYCSELVYKAFAQATGLKIGRLQSLNELNWRPYEEYIRELAGGSLPLDREMITPAAIAASSTFEVIHTSYPAQ